MPGEPAGNIVAFARSANGEGDTGSDGFLPSTGAPTASTEDLQEALWALWGLQRLGRVISASEGLVASKDIPVRPRSPPWGCHRLLPFRRRHHRHDAGLHRWGQTIPGVDHLGQILWHEYGIVGTLRTA